MLQDVPSDVQRGVKRLLSERGEINLNDFSFSGGGCINLGGKLATNFGDFFLKWNDAARLPLMFQMESSGLQLLRRTHAIDIPEVIGFGQEENTQFLVLSFIHQNALSKNYWEKLGHQVAQLHQVTNKLYGLDHHNYIGSLHQFNKQHSSWVNFFIEQRLQIQVKLAVDSGLIELEWSRKFESLYNKLRILIPEEKPSLLHGDLWSGNVLVNEKGDPCIIDPATYFGHREADLAMTQLFEVFDNRFYASYGETFPLLSGHADRVHIYNLYPLLVHLNLFGLAYLNRIKAILRNFT